MIFDFFKKLQCPIKNFVGNNDEQFKCENVESQIWFAFFTVAHVGILFAGILILKIMQRRDEDQNNQLLNRIIRR